MIRRLLRSARGISWTRRRWYWLSLSVVPVLASLPASAQRTVARDISPGALTLQAVFDSVRRQHPDIQAAAARVRAAEGARATAGRISNPVGSYQVENVRFGGAGAVAGLDRETMAMLTLPLEPLYLRGARVARTTADVRAARADVEHEKQRIALEAARAFYRVALARVAVSTGRDLVAWLDSVVAYNGARVREGAAAEADLIRSTLERDRAAAEETMAAAELAQANAQLAAYVGAPAADRDVAVRAGDDPLAVPLTANAARLDTSSLFVARPDIRAAQERATAATAGILGERRMLIRDVGVTLGSKRMMGTTSMIAGVSLPLPLFDQNRGEVARASAERDVARHALAARERSAVAEVTGAAEAARLLTERASHLSRGGAESFLARADEGRRIALGAYREGAIPLLQVIDAARTWGEVRMTYYRTLYAQHESVLTLIVAQGGDLLSSTLTPALTAPAR